MSGKFNVPIPKKFYTSSQVKLMGPKKIAKRMRVEINQTNKWEGKKIIMKYSKNGLKNTYV